MKINRSLIFALCFFLGTSLALANPEEEKLTKENINLKSEAEIEARMETLKDRVEEIRAMGFVSMSRAERKTVRKELKEIKKEMGLDDKFTISVGAAIIIVLLLILIL